MPAENTLAFVIKTQDYRDTSLLVTLYAESAGRVKAIVKGGRTARTQYGSTLEPFSLNSILLYRRKRGDLHLVTQAELVDRFEPLRQNLELLGLAVYTLELVDQLTEEHSGSREIFDLVHEALRLLCSAEDAKRIVHCFELKLMHRLGHLADLGTCVRSGQTMQRSGYFSVASGGFVRSDSRSGEGPLISIKYETMVYMREALKQPLAKAHTLNCGEGVDAQLARVLRAFVDHHLHHRPKSLIFLKKLSQKPQPKNEGLCTSKT